MADSHPYAKLVPGFEFLQGLAQNAGKTLPGIGQWVAPTLDPKELDKRIEELKTVQFWLEQNSRLLATTIQAMEVQKMTLSTLQSMNLRVSDLKDSFTPQAFKAGRTGTTGSAGAQAEGREQAPRKPAGQGKVSQDGKPDGRASSAPDAAGLIDPMKWWGALTEQFGQLAQQALASAPGGKTGGKASAAAGGRPPESAAGAAAAGKAKAPRKKPSSPRAS